MSAAKNSASALYAFAAGEITARMRRNRAERIAREDYESAVDPLRVAYARAIERKYGERVRLSDVCRDFLSALGNLSADEVEATARDAVRMWGDEPEDAETILVHLIAALNSEECE